MKAREKAAAAKKPPLPPPRALPEPELFTHVNDMDIGETKAALDNLTYFEEQLLSPVQPVVRIFTLYSTGLTELRGHVANWVQGGPEFVRAIPLRAGDAKILLVRRFPKEPGRKQRVPFVVSRSRLEAALHELTQPEEDGGHRAFQKNRLTRHGVPVERKNLEAYGEDEEPQDLQVHVAEQKGDVLMDLELFTKWLNVDAQQMQLNGQVKVSLMTHLREQA